MTEKRSFEDKKWKCNWSKTVLTEWNMKNSFVTECSYVMELTIKDVKYNTEEKEM